MQYTQTKCKLSKQCKTMNDYVLIYLITSSDNGEEN